MKLEGNTIHRVVPVVALVVCTMFASAAAAQERITLEEAIQISLVRSPAYGQADVAMDNAGEARRTARGAFLPSVSVNSGASRSGSQRFDPNLERTVAGSGQSMSGGLSASMDVFTGGRLRAELARSEHELDAAEARLEGQQFQVVLQTKTAFFNALRQTDLVALAEARVQRAEESLDLTRHRVEQGTATMSDSLRTRLELANARMAALQAENQLRAARMTLGRQIGMQVPVEPVPPATLDPAPLSLEAEEIYRIAEESSPNVRAARASTESANLGVRTARASYLPSLRMSTGYNWANNDWSFDQGNTSWSVSLSASYPIFNGFNREANVQRATNQVRLARLQHDDARLAARQEVDQALQSLGTAEEAVRLGQEAVLVAREDLRVMRERYEVGVATVFEVVTSQIALDQAEADLVQTRYDLLLARAQLEAILGREL